jgi:hypothetical protein
MISSLTGRYYARKNAPAYRPGEVIDHGHQRFTDKGVAGVDGDINVSHGVISLRKT